MNNGVLYTGWILAAVFILMFMLCAKTWSDLRADAVRNGWAHYEVNDRGQVTLVWNKAPPGAEVEQSSQTKTQR